MLDSLQKERFEDSKKGTGPWIVIRTSEAISRNRYSNIYPWVKNRIRLDVPEGKCDYINASPIMLDHGQQGRKRYIATQVYSLSSASISHIFDMLIYGYRDQRKDNTITSGEWFGKGLIRLQSSPCLRGPLSKVRKSASNIFLSRLRTRHGLLTGMRNTGMGSMLP